MLHEKASTNDVNKYRLSTGRGCGDADKQRQADSTEICAAAGHVSQSGAGFFVGATKRQGPATTVKASEMTDENDLGWHALNYRTAHTLHAEVMWQYLAACVGRLTEAAVAAERERCALIAERGDDGDWSASTGNYDAQRGKDIARAIRGDFTNGSVLE